MKAIGPLSLLLIDLVGASVLVAGTSAPQAAGWLGLSYGYHQTGQRPWLHVIALDPGGPSERAGLRVQDIIVAIDGKPVRFANEIESMAFFLNLPPRRTVTFDVVRRNRRLAVPVITVPLPPRFYRRWQANFDSLKKHRSDSR